MPAWYIVREFQDGCFALRSPAAMNRPPWLVSVSRSMVEIGVFGILYSDEMRTCSFPSWMMIVVESMEVLKSSGLCITFFRIIIAVPPAGGNLCLIGRSWRYVM